MTTSEPFAEARLKGPWNAAQVAAFLEQERSPLRLALAGGSGYPLVVSLWYRFDGEALWCATHRDSHLARRLEQDARVGFEVSVNDPPYRGVRGNARIEMVAAEGEAQLRALLERYLGRTDTSLGAWLLSRADGEVALRIRPRRLTSWDFTTRMQGV